jgi:hypothetical protein
LIFYLAAPSPHVLNAESADTVLWRGNLQREYEAAGGFAPIATPPTPPRGSQVLQKNRGTPLSPAERARLAAVRPSTAAAPPLPPALQSKKKHPGPIVIPPPLPSRSATLIADEVDEYEQRQLDEYNRRLEEEENKRTRADEWQKERERRIKEIRWQRKYAEERRQREEEIEFAFAHHPAADIPEVQYSPCHLEEIADRAEAEKMQIQENAQHEVLVVQQSKMSDEEKQKRAKQREQYFSKCEPKRVNLKNYFITWPKCDKKAEAFEILKASGTKTVNVKWIKIVKETHEDGEPHLHAIVSYDGERVFDLRGNCTIFDVCGHHPNIQRVKTTLQKCDEYIDKEDDEPLVFGEPPYSRKRKSEDVWSAIAGASDKAELMQRAKELAPRDYVLNYDKFEVFAREVLAKPPPYESPFTADDFKLPKAVQDWVDNELPKTERAKCLCLIGPSRFGKTAWARSLGSHVFMRGQTNLDCWNNEAKYIVMDDIGWKYLPTAKQWLTAMGECTVTDKYRSKKNIVNYKPAIYLTNVDPRDVDEFQEERSYWVGDESANPPVDANMIFVTLSKPMFDGPTMTIAERMAACRPADSNSNSNGQE